MSRHGRIRGVERRNNTIAPVVLSLAVLAGRSLARAGEQDQGGPTPPVAPAPRAVFTPPNVTPGVPLAPSAPPGTTAAAPVSTPTEAGPELASTLAPSVQVVRFQGPKGLHVEVLAPAPTPVPGGDAGGIATVGLERGVGYRLRITNITERPGVELFPVIEVVGHLHRPREIDPAKYPIRVVFSDEELWDLIDHGRLGTKVIYLEDPEQAIPIKLAKDQVPVVTLNPTEHPLKVASALGRVMAIVRIGGRRPTVEEIHAGPTGDLGLDAVAAVGATRCPFVASDGVPCPMPCGLVGGTPVSAGGPWLPRDEYLCDGGDHGSPARVGAHGELNGIDPRDAILRFDIGLDESKPHVLPTNRVCVYAPRFAEVRVSAGTNEAIEAHGVKLNQSLDKSALAENRSASQRLVQNQAPELMRERRRAQGLKGRVFSGEDSHLRGLDSYHNVLQAKVDSQKQGAEITRSRVQPGLMKDKVRLDGIKTAESTLLTGLVEGAGQTIMSWRPYELKGMETPPNRPGMAVVKRVSATEAEPGDALTFVIAYRNMGNTPIRSVSIVDSLLPRLEYVKGSAKGPKGTRFSTAENRVGSTELRWELPGIIAPGASGHVSFQVVVR